MMLIIPVFRIAAQEQPTFDEISIYLDVKGIGGTEIPAVISGLEAYLSIADLFTYLRIKNTLSSGMDTLSGFFITPDATYLIDRPGSTITYQKKTNPIPPGDLIRTGSGLYMKTRYFGELFGLDCRFNFRTLSVVLVSKLELPAIREMQQEMMRTNISRLNGEIKADTVLERHSPLLHFGMADWSIISTQQVREVPNTRAILSLGGILLHGETNVTLNYSSTEPFVERDQQYRWRYVDNDFRPLRQSIAGKIDPQSTSTIYNPVVGAQLTNTPTTFRRAFGTYLLRDYTEPGWIVELYVNNVLVDFVKADASGFFSFEVPLVYGNTNVNLRFYGPWGEERSRQQNINIPFNFLPYKEFQYTLSGGMVEDGRQSIYSRAEADYGLTRRITVGGGVEYLSSVTSGKTMPFAGLSLRISNNLLFTGEYTYNVRAKGILNYRLPSGIQFEGYYTWYDKDQTAISYNYREERKAVVSVPIRGRRTMLLSMLTVNQIILPQSRYTTAELLFSGSVMGINTNFTTYALFTEPGQPYVYSRLSLGIRLPAKFLLTPQAQFEYNDFQFATMKIELEKHLFAHGYANLAYEQSFRSDYKSIQLVLRYDLPFAQAAATARTSNLTTTFIETMNGSLMFDPATGYAGGSNRLNVGKGGFVIIPFLDLNCNGKHETGEPRAPGLGIRVNGGRIRYHEKDTTIRVFDLEPYTRCYIELDRNSFDNIAWQLGTGSLSVSIEPNCFKRIDIPISVYGEVTGKVYLDGEQGLKGLGRILINIYSADSSLFIRTMSEEGGYFSYLGLPPGAYYASVDPAQATKLKIHSEPAMIPFNVSSNLEGDYITGLEFKLTNREALPSGNDAPVINRPK